MGNNDLSFAVLLRGTKPDGMARPRLAIPVTGPDRHQFVRCEREGKC